MYHLVYYETLIDNHKRGIEAQDKARLNDFFKERGLTTRLIDNIRLDADTCEEPGFLLSRLTGSMKTTAKNIWLMKELCKKLSILQPESPAILIKNPWDTASAPKLSQWFPNAKFVFLARSEEDIFKSQFHNALHYGGEPDPYLDLLLKDNSVARNAIKFQRWLSKVLPKSAYRSLFKKLLTSDISKQLDYFSTSLAQMPEGKALRIDYENLVKNPSCTFDQLGQFLNINPVSHLGDVLNSRNVLDL